MNDAKEKRCTCDDFTDEPCFVHFRENQLQNRALEMEQDLQLLLTAVDEGLGLQDVRLAVRDIEKLRQDRDAAINKLLDRQQQLLEANNKLLDAQDKLATIKVYLQDHEDIVDGENGPRPNWAMSMLHDLKKELSLSL